MIDTYFSEKKLFSLKTNNIFCRVEVRNEAHAVKENWKKKKKGGTRESGDDGRFMDQIMV